MDPFSSLLLHVAFSRINEEASQRWHLEWARIIISIENEMSLSQRLQAKYWVDVEGSRFLQVQEVLDSAPNSFAPLSDAQAEPSQQSLLSELGQLRDEVSQLRTRLRLHSPPPLRTLSHEGEHLRALYEAPSPPHFPRERPITRSMTRRRHMQHIH
jgi:hypothetical protein